MTSLTVSIPDTLFSALRKAPVELASEMRIAASMHWYQQGQISMERAAEAAGMDRVAFFASGQNPNRSKPKQIFRTENLSESKL
jgi:xanthine dehydrogenase molybdopterin-binding subunit B